MNRGVIGVLAAGIGLGLFALTMVWPPVMLMVHAAGEDAAPMPQAAVPFELWPLLGRSAALAATATLVAMVLALPGAYAIGRMQTGRLDGLAVAIIVLPLLFAPMVFGFGWQRILRAAPGWIGCIGVWASWAWPVASLVLGMSWLRVGRSVYQQAVLDAGSVRAFVRAVLPLLRGPIGMVMLVLFAYFLGDYSVPHACEVSVAASVLLDRATSSTRVADTLLPAIPLVAVIALTLALAGWAWFRASSLETGSVTLPAPRRWRLLAAPLALAGLCIVVPLVGIALNLPAGMTVISSLGAAVSAYGSEILQSLSVAFGAGCVGVLMGVCLVGVRGVRTLALVWSVLWAAIPGALVGQAMIAAYMPFAIIYDHWPLMVFAYVARHGWIGILAAWLSQWQADREQLNAAQTDGADHFRAVWHIGTKSAWPMLAAGVFVATALNLSEAAATSLVRVPSVNSIAIILIEKFHRFEDEMLIALSLVMAAAAAPAVWLASRAARSWR